MINCVILCGGAGSRLWPLSREKLPKQLLPLVNEFTMLQNTIMRFNKLTSSMAMRFTIICNIEHAFLVQTQINDLHQPVQATIVAEPMGRDTAPAVAIAPDTVIVTPEAVAPTLVVDTIVTEPVQTKAPAPKSKTKRGPAKITAKSKSPAVPAKSPRKPRSKKV